jgi:aminoglycoside 6'-N-acetyltransferase
MEDNLGDYSLLAEWLSNQAVLEYYEGRDKSFDLDKVINKFGPRVRGEKQVTPCIIEYERCPIGYIQYYKVDFGEYGINDEVDIKKYVSPYAIDLFIGNTNYWNKGIGTKIVQAIIEYLFKYEKVDAIFIDPQTSNKRAIKCYEKSGFKPIKIIQKRELHEGEYRDSLIMVISKNYYF